MKRIDIAALAVIAAALASAPEPVTAGDLAFMKDVMPVLQRHCVQCHGGATPKADMALDTLAPDFAMQADAWNGVLDRLADGTMPPKNRPRPTDAERKVVIDWVAAGLAARQSQRAATEGRTRLRRLNRVEYVNTLHDLLGVEADIELLPEDGVASGFDNVDAALDLSPNLLESYMETADAALDVALVKGPRPETTRWRVDFVPLAKQLTRSLHPMPHYGDSTLIHEKEVVFFSESQASKPVLDAKAPQAGLYRYRLSANAVNGPRRMTLLLYAGNYGRGLQGLTTRPIGVVDVADTPSVAEFTAQMGTRESIRFLPHGLTNVYVKVTEDFAGPGLAAQWLEVEGPIIESWPPAATTRLLAGVDLAQGTLADAATILRRFAPRAFRRPVADSELEPYLNVIKSRLEKGYSFEEALRVGIKGLLCSADFLYLAANPGRLNDFDLATRLAYFLWSSPPDDTLTELAAKGELSTPDVLRSQVERMLGDPKAHAFTENFTGQWLSLRNLKATMPDKRLYPEFDDLLEYSMPRETYSFFEVILRENRSVLEFLHSDWSMLNERLATHYGIPGVEGSEFRKVALPADSHRGGVITQAAVLKVTANGTNTSPVIRGAWVLDRILGIPAPPPPKDVPAIEPDVRGAKTIREQLAKHRQIESCAVCHAKIDPAGNALENFDVIGGWRVFYRTVSGSGTSQVRIELSGGRRRGVGKGPDVDAADELAGGRKFKDIDGFKQLALDDPDQFARGLTEKLLVYATGHGLEFADREAVAKILAASKQDNYAFRTLIQTIVQSPIFRSK